jgi:hypothetical protein
MISLPQDLLTRFELILKKSLVPDQLRNYYKKWLQYYLDFCRKYNQQTATEESLQQFINKLNEKNQTTQQQRQTSDAIRLYLEMLHKRTSRRI